MPQRTITEKFIKSRNNVITLTLTENGTAVAGAYTDLDIDLVHPEKGTVALNISRTSDGNGVALSATTGVLTINPGLLTEDLSALLSGATYRVYVRVIDGSNAQGVIFGADDSDALLYFAVSDPV